MPADWRPDIATVTLLLRRPRGQSAREARHARQPLRRGRSRGTTTECRCNARSRRSRPTASPSALRERVRRRGPGARRVRDRWSAATTRRSPPGSTPCCSRSRRANTRAEALAQLATIHANLALVDERHHDDCEDAHAHRAARRAPAQLPERHQARRHPCPRASREPEVDLPRRPRRLLELPLGHYTEADPRSKPRASGTFTMTVTLESADGSFELGPPTRVTIRSAVFSGIGIAAHGRRALVPRRLVGKPLPPVAPRAPARARRRERRAEHPRRRARPPRPIERGGRDGHAAVARHRAAARRGPRLRGRARQPRRHLQPRQLDAQHRLRAAARRRAVGHARPALRRSPRTRRRPRDVGGLHGRVDGARRPDRDRDGVRAAHRPALRARHVGSRAHRPAARDDGLHALVPPADGVLRPHRARHRAAQRPPPLRRRRVRAGPQQRHRDRRARRVRAT